MCSQELPSNHDLVPPVTPVEIQWAFGHKKKRKVVEPTESLVMLESLWFRVAWVFLQTCLTTYASPGKSLTIGWSMIALVLKDQGSMQECKNYHGIKVMSYTMVLFEPIIDCRIRLQWTVSECQCKVQDDE